MGKLFGGLRLPSTVVFGSGQRSGIGSFAASLGGRALVCTDERMSGDPQFRSIIDGLAEKGVECEIFAQTEPDLPISGVGDCVAQFASFSPAVVLGIGGGSCMDMAKCVALQLTHGGSLRDYYGENRVPSSVLPIIAVPTTAGTGSEVTPVAVVADTELGSKVGISSPYLIPTVAICDPELTRSCPPALTACSGADALTHAVEAFTAARRSPAPGHMLTNVFVGKNELSDAFALIAIKNIFEALPKAYLDGSDHTAREQLMLASLAAGCAFGTAGTAAAHAIQYPVGNETHTPHGLGVASILPYVMEFNRPNCVAEFAQIGRVIGLRGDDASLSHQVIDAVAELLQQVDIPATLQELGLPEDKIEWTAVGAMGAARLVNNNPRALDVESVRLITRAAFYGDRASLTS